MSDTYTMVAKCNNCYSTQTVKIKHGMNRGSMTFVCRHCKCETCADYYEEDQTDIRRYQDED